MQYRSALRFLLTTTVALHIKYVFVINSDEEVLILAFFFQIIYKCSRFIFIATVLKSHFILAPQKHTHSLSSTALQPGVGLGLLQEFLPSFPV